MADVTINEVAFGEARLVKLARVMNSSFAEALGILALVWHESQELKRTNATKEEILEWCRIDGERGEHVLRSLVESRYLVPDSEGKYEIRGNSRRLSAETGPVHEGAGGVALQLTPPEPVPNRTKKKKEPPKSNAAWAAYASAYEARYGYPPLRCQQANTDLCRLIDKVGAEAAPEIARFYLSHNSKFYVEKLHPTWLLARDAPALHTQWRANQQMLSSKAQEIERRQHNVSAFSGAAMRMGLMPG